MKYDLASDLHSDLWLAGVDSILWTKIKNEGSEVLVIAGDISNYFDQVRTVISRAASVYPKVIFVDGNHEHYCFGGEVDDLETALKEWSSRFPNVTYLTPQNFVQIGNTVFIGCNGWYDFRVNIERFGEHGLRSAWLNKSNDSRMINFGKIGVRTRALIAASTLCSKFMTFQDQAVDIVVVTHTAPHPDLVGGYVGHEDLDAAYCNTAMQQVINADSKQQIKVWCYGHTHRRTDKNIGHIRFVNNSRGYQSEARDLGNWFLAQIDTEDQSYGEGL